MKLTKDEIIERWKAFNIHYARIQEIKSLADEMDRDGDFDDPEYMQLQMSDFIKEINYLYHSCMLPMLDEIVSHINEYSELIDQIVIEEKFGDIRTIIKNVEDLLKEKEKELKSADVSKIVEELKVEDDGKPGQIHGSDKTQVEEHKKPPEDKKIITERILKKTKKQDEKTTKQIKQEIQSVTEKFKKKKRKTSGRDDSEEEYKAYSGEQEENFFTMG
jgi:hypothetical protein